MRADSFAKTAPRIALVAALIYVVLVCALPAQSAITKFDVANKADRAVITVCGDSALRMMPLISPRGNYVGFQFPSRLAAKGRLVGVHSGRIYNVRVSSFRANPPVTRIVVNTAGHHDYSTVWSDDRRRVEISIMKLGVLVPKCADVKVKGSVQEVRAPANVEPATAPLAEPRPVPVVAAPSTTKSDYTRFAVKSTVPQSNRDMVPVTTPKVEAQVVTAPEPEPAPVAEPQPADVVAAPSTTKSDYTRFAVKPTPEAPTPKTEAAPGVRIASTSPTFMASLPQTPEIRRPSPDRSVSLNFMGAEINEVLKALAIQSGNNIVSSKDVKGNITVTLNKVSMEEAMDYVAKLSGYSYTKDNGTYLVAAADKLGEMAGGASDDTVTEITSMKYINADEVIMLLKQQYPDVQASKVTRATKGRIEGMKLDSVLSAQPNNSLVLMGSRTKVAGAISLIVKVDESMKTQAQEEKSSVYTVKYVNVPELARTLLALVPGIRVALAPSEGFDLAAPANITVSASGSNVAKDQAAETVKASSSSKASGSGGADTGSQTEYDGLINGDTKSKALIIIGSEADVLKAKELAVQLDTKSPQVKIDAKVTSINKSGEKKLGVTWDWDGFGMFEGFTNFATTTDLAPTAVGTNQQNVQTPHNKWFRQPFNISAVLEALVTSGDGQLLASPSISCMEGKPAVFFVGDEVTYIQRIETTPTGQNITTDTKQVGVQLRVAARTSSDGFITLNLHPEVSVLKLSVQQGVTLPIVTRRFTDHVVRVKDGATIVIGGLIRNDEIEELSKVPFLGDLPFLGNLFRHKSKTNDHTEVVMFITATILAD